MNTGFIGMGSMGGMLVRTLLRSRALSPSDIWIANRSQGRLDAFLDQCPGVHPASSSQLAAQCKLIFICTGATEIAGVLAQIDSELTPEHLLLTTSAAVSLQALEDRVPCRVGKVIPSITQEIGTGISLLMYGSRMHEGDRALLEKLLGHISRPVVIPESLGRPAIGLTSGGPAMIAYLLQSMAEEAVRSNQDLSPDLARELVRETASATIKLAAAANMSCEEIIRRVAVPGGMTEMSIELLSRYVPEAWQTVFREAAAREKKSRQSLAL